MTDYDYEAREAKGKELAQDLKVGNKVLIQSLVNVEIRKIGIVQSIDRCGFEVDNLWYGWHELESIIE